MFVGTSPRSSSSPSSPPTMALPNGAAAMRSAISTAKSTLAHHSTPACAHMYHVSPGSRSCSRRVHIIAELEPDADEVGRVIGVRASGSGRTGADAGISCAAAPKHWDGNTGVAAAAHHPQCHCGLECVRVGLNLVGPVGRSAGRGCCCRRRCPRHGFMYAIELLLAVPWQRRCWHGGRR